VTRIAVVGAGIAGLHLGLALRAHDVEVAIYTDRAAAEVEAGPLLNTVAHHHHTLQRERALGVCHWEADDYGYGCHHHCVVGAGPDPVRFRGDFEYPSVVIDHRLYLPRLMGDFEERGGELIVGAVSAPALDRLAREHDLLVICTGRAGLATLFGRRDDKSPYEVPQRRLSAGVYHGISYPQPTGVGVHMSLGHGELLELPITSREGRATVLLFENIPGGGLDELVDRPYGDDPPAYERLVLDVLETHYPACFERVDRPSFGLQAPRDILQGALTPIVREDWAILEDARIALAAGDAHTVVDPVNGQGANSASHSAWVIAQAIVDDYGLDERFARRVARDREAVVLGVSDWTNMTLNPPPQMVELLFAMASSKPLCDAFSRNFNHPDRQADALATSERTAAFIARWSRAG
jgi:2-polyprenyl-6-methoxyphenol hydroxylase-like FAD-dependent oxidoreductase